MAAIQDLSLRQLQYVVAVADTLGFHRAAARCHVSQPALSEQISQIEGVLGVRLFERDRRRVLVTAAGEAIVARARRVLVEVEDLIAAAAHLADPFQGTFRVGVIPTIAPYLLPEMMPALARSHPRLQLVFREERTAAVVRDLGEGRIDAGLVALEAELGELAHEEVLVDEFVVALPKGHPLAARRALRLADLEDAQVLLLDEGHCLRTQALALCTKVRARESDFRATSLATLAQMVSAGSGVTLLPRLALTVENRRGQLEIRPLEPPAPSRTIALVWRPTSPLAEAFRTFARSMAAAVGAAAAISAGPRARSGRTRRRSP